MVGGGADRVGARGARPARCAGAGNLISSLNRSRNQNSGYSALSGARRPTLGFADDLGSLNDTLGHPRGIANESRRRNSRALA